MYIEINEELREKENELYVDVYIVMYGWKRKEGYNVMKVN